MASLSGFILHTQRLSTEDGPGIRSTVFFKGCPLQCRWCHNPESLSSSPQVQWLEHQCIACGTCVGICPNNCLAMTERGIMIDWERCEGCGICARECPTNAMEFLGKKVSVGELFGELVKDRAYYESSGGGITVSGGEPLLQPDFVAALMQQLQTVGIQTALDTCGFCSGTALEKVLPHTDLVLFDLKEINPARHRAFTGQDNHRILENLLLIRDWLLLKSPEKRLWIRTPLIPDATATQQNLEGIGAFIATRLNGLVQRWELCAFNNLCRDKYRRLGLAWSYADTPLMTRRELRTWEQTARRSGVDPEIVITTGAVRESDE